MSIVPLKKVALCGLLKEKADLLQGLQDLGCLHLVPLRPAPAEPETAASPHAEDATKALRFLTDMKDKRKQVTRDPDFDVDRVVAEARAVQQRLRDVTDRRDFLLHRIKQVEPWGDLLFPPHAELAGHRLWFYILPAGKLKALEGVDLPWQIVHRDPRRAYVVLIAHDEPPADILPVPRTHTGALPLNELKHQLEDCEVEIEALVAERQALTRFIYLLSVNLARAEDRAMLAHASELTRDDVGLFAVQGWAPEDAVPQVEAFAEAKGLACLIEAPGPADAPPTMLDNPQALAAGSDLAMFYQTPGYRAWDPSLVVFFSFCFFFAMILSDAGYALVLLGLLVGYWAKLGRSAGGRRFRVLGACLCGSALVWGVLSGGYFGRTPAPGSGLDALHLIDLNDFESMMRLSIVIGALHIVLANGVTAYLNRHDLGLCLSKLGWIAAVAGGLLAWLGAGGDLTSAGFYLLAGGLAAVFWFSGRRPCDSAKGLLLRGLDGLQALTNVTKAFGDVLSYMRLFALGLASASLALTFNQLAAQVNAALPGLGLFISILILLLGHSLNLALSIMSGVVHGLRLNFIEFYNWGMSEEGYPFKAFARKEVQP